MKKKAPPTTKQKHLKNSTHNTKHTQNLEPLIMPYLLLPLCMEIYLESLLRSGIVVGVEYFPGTDKVKYQELCISLLFVRFVLIWK